MLKGLRCMSRSRIEKCTSKVVWETLTKARHANEKLVLFILLLWKN